jgi:hypothetical protein
MALGPVLMLFCDERGQGTDRVLFARHDNGRPVSVAAIASTARFDVTSVAAALAELVEAGGVVVAGDGAFGVVRDADAIKARARAEAGRLRAYVLERDGHRCVYCGDALTLAAFCIDHVVPLARGGTSAAENLAAACSSCNASKRDMTVEEWRQRGVAP